MRIAKQEGLLISNTDILYFFFFSIAKFVSWPTGKIGEHTPASEGLNCHDGMEIIILTSSNRDQQKSDPHD